MAQIRETIEKIGWDLLNLEINTIITTGIQGKKMPDPRDALAYIAAWYREGLKERGADISGLDGKTPAGRDAFLSIESIASQKIKEIEDGSKGQRLSPEAGADYLMLCRIRDLSEQLVKMFGTDGKDLFNADDRVLIRKIWEVGLDEIAIQTVIQIDGDVVTRIEPQFANSDDRSKVLRSIHESNVTVCLGAWKELVGVVKDFFNNLLNLLVKS